MDILGILAELHGQRDRITQAIEALESLNGSTASTTPPTRAAVKEAVPVASSTAKKRVLSPEGRKAIADATRKRWAKKKRAAKAAAKKAAAVTPAAVKPAAVKPAKDAPAAFPVVKKVGKPMSPATKKKLALAAKARWAAKKTAVKG